MTKTLLALVGGLVVGGMATYYVIAVDGSVRSGSSDAVVRDIAEVPKMSANAASQHRESHFEELRSVEQIYALPTAFAQSEALYALAGRSDSAAVQSLIFEANRIADENDRRVILGTLFFRLAELDPQSALMLARTEYFAGDRSLERAVWRTWANANLDDAVVAAKNQTTRANKNAAAQALYAAFGYMGNERTDYLEAELGIGPDRETRSRFLRQMADRSAAEAVAYINQMSEGATKSEFVSWLAHHLSQNDTTVAQALADQFDSAMQRKRFENIIASNAAKEDPHATITRLLASGGTRRNNSEFYSAANALAETDLDAAMLIFEDLNSIEDKQAFGAAIAHHLANRDESEALAWARANDTGEYPYLTMTVLVQITHTDPQLAIAAAQEVDNIAMRAQLVGNVISNLARLDPAETLPLLDQIKNEQQKQQAEQQLTTTWLRQDPDAAIAWILGNDEEKANRLIQSARWPIMRRDIDVAIRLLPKLGKQQQSGWRQQIAEQLAIRRSPQDAENFIAQFEGQEDYSRLRASVIKGIAQKDPMSAKHMADELVDRDARDTAYADIIGQRAQKNPLEAASWLPNIFGERQRSRAVAQLTSNWHASNPEGAYQWANQLPPGQLRDDAVLHLSSHWSTPTSEQEEMIDNISDPEKRGQAKVQQIYNVMQSDPIRARQMLERVDISKHQRRQVETRLEYFGGGN